MEGVMCPFLFPLFLMGEGRVRALA